MNWITKLERKYGRFCIPNLINILIGGQILVYAIELFVNQYISFYLSLSRSALFAGQIWRLFTFVLVPFRAAGRSAWCWASILPGSSAVRWNGSGAISVSTSTSCWGWQAHGWPAC